MDVCVPCDPGLASAWQTISRTGNTNVNFTPKEAVADMKQFEAVKFITKDRCNCVKFGNLKSYHSGLQMSTCRFRIYGRFGLVLVKYAHADIDDEHIPVSQQI